MLLIIPACVERRGGRVNPAALSALTPLTLRRCDALPNAHNTTHTTTRVNCICSIIGVHPNATKDPHCCRRTRQICVTTRRCEAFITNTRSHFQTNINTLTHKTTTSHTYMNGTKNPYTHIHNTTHSQTHINVINNPGFCRRTLRTCVTTRRCEAFITKYT